MRIVIIGLLMLSVSTFGQTSGKKEAVKVKKVVAPAKDTSYIRTTSITAAAPLFVVDQMPYFSGGNDAMYTLIQKNIKYPDAEKKAKIQGIVIVGFIVEADGSITNVRTIKGIPNGTGCDAEAIRVVKLMPNWIPGKQGGKAAAVETTLSIKFSL